MNEAEIDTKLREYFQQWHHGLITNRELMGVVVTLYATIPPITVGDLDPNTGLRYTAESIKAR
jgi:hypothetical protein